MREDRAYDPERLAELIVYIAERSFGDPRFGKTKLNKILFFADFGSYRRNGASITGATYQHLPQGPCPHQLLPVIASLGDSVAWAKRNTMAGVQEQLVALRPAKVELFAGSEIALVEEILDEFRGLTNQQVSALSHETLAWRLTSDRQEIPYEMALLPQDPPSDEDLAWLEEVAVQALRPSTPSTLLATTGCG